MSQYSLACGCDGYDGPLPSPAFCELSVTVKENSDRTKGFVAVTGRKLFLFWLIWR